MARGLSGARAQLDRYKAAVLVVLYALALGPLLYAWSAPEIAWLAGAAAALAVGYTLSLRAGDMAWFSALAGASVLLGILALTFLTAASFAALWAELGAGLAAILVANHLTRASALLPSVGDAVPEAEAKFRAASRSGVLRVVYFVGLVMVISVLVLLLSLNLSLGSMNIAGMAIAILVIMIALAILASLRHGPSGQ